MARSKSTKRSSKKRAPKKVGKAKPGTSQYNSAYARRAGTGEKKYVDYPLQHQDASTAGRVYGDILTIAAGTGINQRIGNKITVVNVNFRGRIMSAAQTATASAYLDGERVRVMWFWDTQANGTVPKVTDVLQTAEIDSFRNMEQAPRFVILKDKTYVFNATDLPGADSQARIPVVTREHKFAWKGQSPIHYGTVGQDTAGIRANNLCLLVICDQLETGSGMEGTIRVKYTDN